MSLEERREELAQAVHKAVEANVEKEEVTISETNEAEQAVPEAELSEVEKQAREMGWDPEHKGKSFVSAEEYVRRGPLFDKIEKQNKDIRELKDLMKQSAAHMSAVRKEAYDRAIQDLEARKFKTVEEGNTQEYQRTEAQIRSLQTKMQADPLISTPAPSAPEANEHEQDFSSRNAGWYNRQTPENNLMMESALGFDRLFAQQASLAGKVLSPKEHLRKVEEAVRQQFPHRFENQKKEAPSAVARSTAPKDQATKGAGLIAQMTPAQRQFGEYFIKHAPKGATYSLEQYAEELKATNRLGK